MSASQLDTIWQAYVLTPISSADDGNTAKANDLDTETMTKIRNFLSSRKTATHRE